MLDFHIIEASKGRDTMEEMLKTLHAIGMTDEQCLSVKEHYDGDLDGLTRYVLYCIALFDDRHEYLA